MSARTVTVLGADRQAGQRMPAVRKANPGRSYTSRQAEGGMRVWRVT